MLDIVTQDGCAFLIHDTTRESEHKCDWLTDGAFWADSLLN